MRLVSWHDAFTELLSGNKQPLAHLIDGTEQFPRNKRLDVYRNNHTQGIISYLGQIFERCQSHVGEAYFAQLAKSYLSEYPPNTTALVGYGGYFPDHLQSVQVQRPELNSMAYLPDLAKLDWLCDQIYYSPASKPWPQQTFNELTQQQQAECILLLSSDCRLFRSHWPLSLLWELHAERCTHAEMHYLEQAEFLVLYRQDYRIHLEKISADIYHLIRAVQEGSTLQQLSQRFPNTIRYLPELISHGWIHDFKVQDLNA